MALRLVFYDDEEEYTYQPQRRRHPRKSRCKAYDAFQHHLLDWQTEQLHERVLRPKGNSIIHKYYYSNILPY